MNKFALSLLITLAAHAAYAEAISVQEPLSLDILDEKVAVVARNVADVYGLSVALPESALTKKISLEINKKSPEAIFNAIAKVSGYEVTEEDGIYTFTETAPAWVPIPGAKKVASGLIIQWVAPEDGIVIFAESTRKIVFETKSLSKGQVFGTLKAEKPEPNLAGLIEMSIPEIKDKEVFPTLSFNLYFVPSSTAAGEKAE